MVRVQFIDYVTLLLLNMSAGFIILALYLLRGLDEAEQGRWALGFCMVGVVAAFFGAHMSLTWPLPAQFSSVYGDFSVFFGAIFLFAGLGLALRWRLELVAVYAIPIGLASLITAVRFVTLKLSSAPLLAASGFFLTGLAALAALPTLLYLRENRGWRVFAGIVLLLIALIWLATAFGGLWMHLDDFKGWVPLVIRPR